MAAGLLAVPWPVAAAGQQPSPTISDPVIASTVATTQYLDVSVNGWPTRLVARFRDEAGRLSLPADQFEGLGFVLDEAWVTQEGEGRRVFLDRVQGLTWRVDLRAQTIDLVAPYDRLRPERLSINPAPIRVDARSGRGALLSYDLFGEWAIDPNAGSYGRSLSTVVEARAFTSRFTLSSTGGVSVSSGIHRAIRYESYLAFDDPDKARSLRVGDGVTRGLIWSRNLRFGGIQYQSNFALRPDIVTTPLPDFKDGVATPSVLELYVDGVKRYSSGVKPGAFEVDQLPVLTGTNQITMVLTDLDGRERTVTLPFYVTSRLLRRGISDFSFEAGALRENFGTLSNDYGLNFVSATWRRGLTDALTVEAHGEGADGLWLAGVSGAVAVRALASVSASLAVSRGPAGEGTLWALGFERVTHRLSLSARHEEADADFQDVAALAGQPHTRIRDIASAGLNMGRVGAFNLTYVSETAAGGARAPVATASYGVDVLGGRARLAASGYALLNQDDQWGATVRMVVPLGGRGYVSTAASRRGDTDSYELVVRGGSRDGRLTWQARDIEGDIPSRAAELRWDGARIDARGRVLNDDATTAFQIEAAQSLVLFDGRLFLADRVDEAFAVVRVGDHQGVEVFRENQSVGRTDANGRLFVNHLRAYEINGLSIDPKALPLDAALDSTTKAVSPRRGGGLAAVFEVRQARSALVILKTSDGAAPPAGAEVRLEDHIFPMGYGGEVYLRGLSPGRSVLRVAWRGHACTATIEAPARMGDIAKLGPYLCAP